MIAVKESQRVEILFEIKIFYLIKHEYQYNLLSYVLAEKFLISY